MGRFWGVAVILLILFLFSGSVGAKTPGYLVIQGVEGVDIYVDGNFMETTRQDELSILTLLPDRYTFLFVKAGYYDLVLDLRIRSAESRLVVLEMEEVEVREKPLEDISDVAMLGVKTGTLELRSVPFSGASIRVNGVSYGQTNRLLGNFPIGEVVVSIEFQGNTVENTFTLQEDLPLLLLANFAVVPPVLLELIEVTFLLVPPLEYGVLELTGEYSTVFLEEEESSVVLMGKNHTARITHEDYYLDFQQELRLSKGETTVLHTPVLPVILVSSDRDFVSDEGERVLLEAVVWDPKNEEVLNFPVRWEILNGNGRLSFSPVAFYPEEGGDTRLLVSSPFAKKEILLSSPYRVRGRVLDREGRGVPGVEILFSSELPSVWTNEEGEFEQEGLLGPVFVLPRVPFSVAAQEVRNPVYLEFTEVFTLSGRILDPFGVGVKDVVLSFGEEFGTATTNQEGYWIKEELSGAVTITPVSRTYDFIPDRKTVGQQRDHILFVGENRIGRQKSYVVSDTEFFLRLAPGMSFPKGRGTQGVSQNFWIAETEVTYSLWQSILVFGGKRGYIFTYKDQESLFSFSEEEEPITFVSWYDAIVWCNALSEFLGLEPVYTYQGTVFKDATDKLAGDYVVQEPRNGFRLPTSEEWELAARYIDGEQWTPEDYASGAHRNVHHASATTGVAWYEKNSGGRVREVQTRQANGLGLYDMTGNVWEWGFDWGTGAIGVGRILLGGSFDSVDPKELSVGYRYWYSPRLMHGSVGFRVVQTAQ